MADRKAELERKRAKLNALREEKERKKKDKEELDRRSKARLFFVEFYTFNIQLSQVSISTGELWSLLGSAVDRFFLLENWKVA